MKHLLEVCLAIITLAGCACVAYPEDQPAPTPAGSSASTQPAPISPSDALYSACRKLAAMKSFRATLTTSGTKDGDVVTEIAVQMPDRFHTINNSFEAIQVGPDCYVRFGRRPWDTYSRSLPFISLADPRKLEEHFATSTEVKLVGSEMLDNKPVKIYESVASYAPSKRNSHQPPTQFTARVWVGDSDGLLRKLEGAEANTDVKISVRYHNYNVRLAINPPSR